MAEREIPPEEVRLEHYILLPKPKELPRVVKPKPARIVWPPKLSKQEYDEFVEEWEAHEVDEAHRATKESWHRYLGVLDGLKRALEHAISRFDGRAKKTLVTNLGDPARLLQLAKEHPEFEKFKGVLSPEVFSLLEDRPIINRNYCSPEGVKHRKLLYYLLSGQGLHHVGHGEVLLGHTRRSGPFRTDQLYKREDGSGALFLEVSASLPTMNELARKLKLIQESVEHGHKSNQHAPGAFPHLSRAWGHGRHAVGFYWGGADLADALERISANDALADQVRKYPHDVLLLNYAPRTNEVHAWSVKRWLQHLPRGRAKRNQVLNWYERLPRLF